MIIFRVKQVRESKNITAYKLAKDTKISRSYLSELENNKNVNVSLRILTTIADYLKVNVKDLFYTNFDIKDLKKEMYKRIDKFGINSPEALEISQIIDLLINIDMRKL